MEEVKGAKGAVEAAKEKARRKYNTSRVFEVELLLLCRSSVN